MREAAKVEIELMQVQLGAAQRDVACAETEIDKISALPPIRELSAWVDDWMAQMAIPQGCKKGQVSQVLIRGMISLKEPTS